MTPRVCISVLNWNNYRHTLDCLRSLMTLDYPDYRIIVVDNASADDSVEQIRSVFPRVELICAETNLGYAGGNELALKRALSSDADLFWILNNDTVVAPDTLSHLVAAYQQYGEAIYGGVPLERNNEDDDWKIQMTAWQYRADGRTLYVRRLHGLSYREYFTNTDPQMVLSLSGSCLLIPIPVVRQYGFMDTTFFLYSEDGDYCFRLRKQGLLVVLVPRSTIWHHAGGSYKDKSPIEPLIHYYRVRNHIVLRRRYFGLPVFAGMVAQQFYIAVKQFVKTWLSRSGDYAMAFYGLRAVRDGALGRMGKTYAPEDYV